MKIIYAGTPDFAVPALQALLDSPHQVVAVYTQPDRRAGRGKKLRASPVKQLAEAAGVDVYQPVTLRDETAQAQLQSLHADLMVVAAYGLILPKAVLDAPRLGCINIHASLLPRWRGAAPIQRAIAAGDKESGVTIMQMAEGLDTGDMLLKRSTVITEEDTAASLHDRLSVMGGEALLAVLDQIESGQLQPEVQDDAQANYAEKLTKAEAMIDWQQDAASIVRMIQAFNPWPVAQTVFDGAVLRIWGARLGESVENNESGTVLKEDKQQGVLVQAGSAAVWLRTLQMPGGKPLAAADFLNGRSLLGTQLK